MKNKINALLVLGIMVFVIGCTCTGFGPFSQSETPKSDSPATDVKKNTTPTPEKSLTDKATDLVTSGEKIGVAECDDLMDYFRTQIENENTDMFSKALLKTMESTFREGLRKSIEQNNQDKEQLAKFCKEFKANLDTGSTKK